MIRKEDITEDVLKERVRVVVANKESQNFFIIEEDKDSTDFYLVTILKVKNGSISTKEIDDLTLDEVEEKANTIRGSYQFVQVVDEVDRYLRTYDDDTEYIFEFQGVCSEILKEHHFGNEDKIKAHLSELVSLFRMSERAGLRAADMYNAEVASLPVENQDGIDFPQQLNDQDS